MFPSLSVNTRLNVVLRLFVFTSMSQDSCQHSNRLQTGCLGFDSWQVQDIFPCSIVARQALEPIQPPLNGDWDPFSWG
jgi:hypothetical protein